VRFATGDAGFPKALRLSQVLFRYSAVTPDDYPQLEAVAKMAVKEKQKFERLSLPKEKLLEMFKVGRGPADTTSFRRGSRP
jgi:threonyl-tRNA synthetase